MKKDEKGWEVEDPCGGVQKYMSSEEMDELRRTSRTVCHRLVTLIKCLKIKREPHNHFARINQWKRRMQRHRELRSKTEPSVNLSIHHH